MRGIYQTVERQLSALYRYGGSETYVAELPGNKHMHRIHLQKCLNMLEDVASYRNIYIYIYIYIYTGLFISPSGISDPCGTVAGMVTPKGSMSTEGETLQVSVLPYRCSICAPLLTSEGS